jgi:hypothetical protein
MVTKLVLLVYELLAREILVEMMPVKSLNLNLHSLYQSKLQKGFKLALKKIETLFADLKREVLRLKGYHQILINQHKFNNN